MKHIKIIKTILLLFILSGIISCEDVLDVQPKYAASEATFWNTEKDVNAAVNGVYQVLHDQYTYDIFGMLDVMTPIAHARTVTRHNGVASGVYDANNPVIRDRWAACYRGIVRANDVLTNMDRAQMTDDVRNERRGETLFLRSFFYFNLIYMFGDVPLILDVPVLEDPLPSRTSKDQILTQMHQDLDEAIDLLNEEASDVGRVTKGAALTLKAKLLMQESDYNSALPILEQIMDIGYALYPDYRTLFLTEGENNSEVIFDAQYISETGDGANGNDFNKLYGNRSMLASGFSWLQPTKELIMMYETADGSAADPDSIFKNKDPRMDMTVMRPGATFVDKNDRLLNYPEDMRNYNHSQTGMQMRKFVIEGSSADAPFSNTWDSPNNWIYFRYADVLLLFAEAKVETSSDGVISDAAVYDAINQIRQRPSVNIPAVENGKTKAELREIIRKERAIELAMEGWYYFDLKRWGTLKEMNNGFAVENVNNGEVVLTRIWEDYYDLWPIPQSELDNNPNLLPQNPGYN